MDHTLSERYPLPGEPLNDRLLVTKLYAPSARPRRVSRGRLTERLDEGMRGKLTVVSAPAGSGKTTLLAEWSAQNEKPTTWISIDRNDNDPAVFLSYLIAALRVLVPEAGKDAIGLLRSPRPTPVEAILTILVNEVDAFPDDFALVLDDYHVIESEEVHHAVGFLLDYMPPRMHLFIASRVDPPLRIVRLLAGGQLTRLSATDLRFTPEEASDFLGGTMGLNLSSAETSSLNTSTEGWAAGLQLAAISIRETERIPEFVQGFAGTSRHLLNYLAEEVVGNQTEEVRGFLLRTSVLTRMCAPLCDAVTGRDDGQEMLERLERDNLFLVPLDDEGRWYRYHHLFSDFLLRSLRNTSPDELPGLHRRACDWFERDRLAAEAVGHALAAGDTNWAADLVEKIARTTLRRGELSKLRRWLEALPEDLVHSRPRLCLFYAWYFLADGHLEAIEPYLKRAERPLDPGSGVGADEEVREICSEAITIRAAVAGLRGESSQAVELARKASDLLTEGNQFLQCIIAASLGYARRTDGDVAAAVEAFAKAAEVSRSVGATYVTLLAYKHLAELYTVQGRLRAASDVCDRALDLAAEGGGGLPAASVAHIGMGELLREWDKLDIAAQHLEKGISLGEQGGNVEVVLDGLLALARTRQALGDAAGAADALRKAGRLAENHGRAEWTSRVDAWRARLSVARGDLGAATRWSAESLLSTEDNLTYPREFEHVTLARVLIAQDRHDEALGLLERLLAAAEAGEREGRVIEILLLKALALYARDDTPEALTALGRAAALAEPEGFVRVFADEGAPMAAMLKQLLRETRRRSSDGTQRVSPGYVAKLLAVLGQGTPPAQGAGSYGTAGPLVESLSEREREVLALLASGVSNYEIATRLFLSLDTVKSHLKHLYGKLDVHSRTQAVARAKEFDLL